MRYISSMHFKSIDILHKKVLSTASITICHSRSAVRHSFGRTYDLHLVFFLQNAFDVNNAMLL